jgi:hypothetical protein
MLAPRGSWGRAAAVALELVSSSGADEVGEGGSRRARGWEAGPAGGAQEFGGGWHGGRHDAKGEDGGVRARVSGIPGLPPKIQSNPRHGMAREDQAKEPPPPTQYYQYILPRILPTGNDSGARKKMVLPRSETEGRLTRKTMRGIECGRSAATAPATGPQAAKPQSASALIAATDDHA